MIVGSKRVAASLAFVEVYKSDHDTSVKRVARARKPIRRCGRPALTGGADLALMRDSAITAEIASVGHAGITVSRAFQAPLGEGPRIEKAALSHTVRDRRPEDGNSGIRRKTAASRPDSPGQRLPRGVDDGGLASL